MLTMKKFLYFTSKSTCVHVRQSRSIFLASLVFVSLPSRRKWSFGFAEKRRLLSHCSATYSCLRRLWRGWLPTEPPLVTMFRSLLIYASIMWRHNFVFDIFDLYWLMVNEQLKSEVYDFALSISRMRTRISTREVNPVTDDEVRVHDYDTAIH